MCSCHSIPECCVMFSGIKLSIVYFISGHLAKLVLNSILLTTGSFEKRYLKVFSIREPNVIINVVLRSCNIAVSCGVS